jgi:hypothetical protein
VSAIHGQSAAKPGMAAGVFTAKDYDRALLTPEQVFGSAMDVVDTVSLTAQQKLKVLKRWEADARDLETAADESMSGGERSRFAEVRKAIHALCERDGMDEDGNAVS